MDELVEAWLGALRSPNTRSAYASDLHRFSVWWQRQGRGSVLRAGADDVEEYRRDGKAAGVADATMARWMSALRSFFGYAVEHGELSVSPVGSWAVRVDSSSPTTTLASDEVQRLLRATGALGPRTASLVALQLLDGLRLGEVLGVDVDDVTFTALRARLAVKRRDGEDVLLDRRTTGPLRECIGGRTHGPLLLGESPTHRTARLTRFGADYLIKQAGARVGLPTLSANVLRRTFVAGQHADGVPITAIRDRLGHRDVRTTRRHLGA